MLGKILILLCSAAILVSVESNATTGEKTSLNSEAPSIITNVDKKITTTTTTTKKPTTSTTHSPETTTTSTHAPDTTTIPTTTTTAAPKTTPKPTPAPTPVPIPTDKIWSLNGTNETCIVAQMAVQFEISYPMNKTNNFTQKINLPVENVAVSGSCDQKEQTIILSWNSTKGYYNDSFAIHFTKDDNSKKYSIHHMDLAIVPQELPHYNFTNNKTLTFVHVADEYPTGLGNSYRCVKEVSFKMNSTASNDTSAVLKMNDVQFQAFKSEKNTNFGLAEDCAFDTPDVVPIAVGCALAALVVIVLVAYLIGRRRAQARGYLSM